MQLRAEQRKVEEEQNALRKAQRESKRLERLTNTDMSKKKKKIGEGGKEIKDGESEPGMDDTSTFLGDFEALGIDDSIPNHEAHTSISSTSNVAVAEKPILVVMLRFRGRRKRSQFAKLSTVATSSN